MSKIAKKPILIKEGVSASQEDGRILIRGPQGEISLPLSQGLKVEIKEGAIFLERQSETKKAKSSHGTMARLIGNAIKGTKEGFSRTLEVVGTGYRAQMEGNTLTLSLGFSHPVKLTPPEGIKIETQENKIKISGVDKEKVGVVADRIRKIKKPDAYRGKGILYQGEKLKLKPGKAAAKAGATVTK